MRHLAVVSAPHVPIDIRRARGQGIAVGTLVAMSLAAEVAQVSRDGRLLAEASLASETLVALALVWVDLVGDRVGQVLLLLEHLLLEIDLPGLEAAAAWKRGDEKEGLSAAVQFAVYHSSRLGFH